MNILPKDYTPQEQIIAECLTEFGLRYDPQYEMGPYTVDFYIPEIGTVVEADGRHGHLQKRDRKRDAYLLEEGSVEYIIHIKEFTKDTIKEILWQELNKLGQIERTTKIHGS